MLGEGEVGLLPGTMRGVGGVCSSEEGRVGELGWENGVEAGEWLDVRFLNCLDKVDAKDGGWRGKRDGSTCFIPAMFPGMASA